MMRKTTSDIKLFALVLFTVLISCTASKKEENYTSLYNGKDLTGWTYLCRGDDPELALKVFTPDENGELHIFKDIPDSTGMKEGKYDTHGMIFTEKTYRKYSFKFEFRWGKKIYNNFDKYQYDSGIYYHIFEDKIWPKGIEFQIRYDHLTGEDHTAAAMNSGSLFDWVASPDGYYLSLEKGGTQQERIKREHKCSADAKINGLNDQWNVCEIIVMGDEYAIHKVNGQVVNVITNLSHKEGRIGIQAETAEIYFRNVKILEFEESIPIGKFLN